MVQAIDHPIRKPKTYTLHEYLAREKRSLHKNEFHNGQIVKKPSSTIQHNVIATNILIEIGMLLRQGT
jgi:Uma2 family endonuclease